jgi:hypothetical protein
MRHTRKHVQRAALKALTYNTRAVAPYEGSIKALLRLSKAQRAALKALTYNTRAVSLY